MGFVWVHADSFLGCVASPFHSFVTTFLAAPWPRPVREPMAAPYEGIGPYSVVARVVTCPEGLRGSIEHLLAMSSFSRRVTVHVSKRSSKVRPMHQTPPLKDSGAPAARNGGTRPPGKLSRAFCPGKLVYDELGEACGNDQYTWGAVISSDGHMLHRQQSSTAERFSRAQLP